MDTNYFSEDFFSKPVEKQEFKYYKRSIDDGHGWQELTIVDGYFYDLNTYANNGWYTEGSFVPYDYKKGTIMPRGFLKKYGFKRYQPKFI